MEQLLRKIKYLEGSRKSLQDSVLKTIDALQQEIDYLKSENGICSIDGCYKQAVRMAHNDRDNFMLGRGVAWLCDEHYKKN